MTSHEHLEHLLELRRALLREAGRLDRLIASEISRAPHTLLRHARSGALSWEEALHEAKIASPREAFLPG